MIDTNQSLIIVNYLMASVMKVWQGWLRNNVWVMNPILFCPDLIVLMLEKSFEHW